MMSPRQAAPEARLPDSESVFSRVVVGVDGTEPGFEACRQAARLADPHTPIEAVAVVHLADAARAGPNAPRSPTSSNARPRRRSRKPDESSANAGASGS